MKKYIAIATGWVFGKMTYIMPSIFYIEVWPKHKHRPHGPDNVKGMRIRPYFIHRILKWGGGKVDYFRGSTFY